MTIDGAGAEILAEIDRANAEMTGERRAQRLLVEDGLLLRDLRLGVLQVGGIGVERRLADRLDLELLLVALVGDLRSVPPSPAAIRSLATSSSERSFSSTAPSSTSSPELNEIESTTPETSSDRSAPLTARRLPTASIFGCHSLHAALAGGDGLRRRAHRAHELLDHGGLERLESEDAAEHDGRPPPA